MYHAVNNCFSPLQVASPVILVRPMGLRIRQHVEDTVRAHHCDHILLSPRFQAFRDVSKKTANLLFQNERVRVRPAGYRPQDLAKNFQTVNRRPAGQASAHTRSPQARGRKLCLSSVEDGNPINGGRWETWLCAYLGRHGQNAQDCRSDLSLVVTESTSRLGPPTHSP